MRRMMMQLVHIEPEKKLPLPPVSAALGMALAYYFYPLLIPLAWGQYLLMALLFFLVVLVSILRVLRSFPGDNPAVLHKLDILVLALAVGFSLGLAARRNVQGQAETGLATERVIAVSGILQEDPRSLQGGSGLGLIELSSCSGEGGLRASARGSLTVFFPSESIPRLKEFGRGCEVYVDGKLSEASRGPLFNASSVHIVKPAPALEQYRTGLRITLLEKFQSRQGRATPVWGALASALLLGVRDDLNVALSEGFRNAGCSHILALSGMHLAIISGLLTFLIRRPLGIRWASLVGAVFVIIYVFVAGSQPSLVRSAIMYLIAAFSLWGFLKSRTISLLCMAFIIQLILQSETGTSLSFILSYLALFGILTIGETLRALFRGRLPEILNGSFSASIGAFILTAPVVVLFFGSLKPIGILAGLILAPLASLFMVLALAALAASFLPIPLWNLLDFILSQVYRLLEVLVNVAGSVPGINVSNPWLVLAFSIFFWLLVLFLKKQDSVHRDSIASFE